MAANATGTITPTTQTPAPTTSITPRRVDPAPTPSPSAPKTQPKTTTPKTQPSPKKPATPSEIPAPVDPKTQQFRNELSKRQARLDALQAQLDALDRELEIATENYNAALERLNATKKKLDVTEADLKNAQAAYDTQAKSLEDRVRLMYSDETAFESLRILLDSKSFSDFIQRVTFITTISEKDAELAVTLANQRDSVQQALVDLKDSKLEAEQLEFNLKARRIEIQLRIQERQQMLASAQSDLLALLGNEQTRRQADEALLLQQIVSGASGVGIKVVPGSPAETALAYHGIPYLWGGATPSGFDCSGLVLYVFAQHGVNLPHYSGDQFQLGLPVQPADLQSGDVVFFGSPVHHVGIYLGNDYFIHAPRTGDYVKVSKLSDRHDFAGARRYPWIPRIGPIRGVTIPASVPSVPITH
jgi:cell wall-associated NlpC family hydrolase